LEAAGKAAAGGTVVVTLEPCAHHARTPPCADRLIASGVATVIFGAIDPDDRVSGKGAAKLQAAGVTVIGGLLDAEAEAADPAYFHHRRTGRPLVTLKAALTMDGQTGATDGTSQWITGPAAREDAHRLRAETDAVMVGAGTVRADDPRLDVRLEGYAGPQPRPVVVTGTRPIPPTAQVFGRNPLVVGSTTTGAAETGSHWETALVDPGPDGLPDLAGALRAIGDRGLLDVLVEGGPTLAGALWKQGLVDRGVFYLAGRIAGGTGLAVFDAVFATLEEARTIEIVDVNRLGRDLRIDWRPI
jgi:diaminohydroxyphosphoribosylaminopyrimidine deaminase/5-amino-6-(5-phosphoribosylamino)uracil reductase